MMCPMMCHVTDTDVVQTQCALSTTYTCYMYATSMAQCTLCDERRPALHL